MSNEPNVKPLALNHRLHMLGSATWTHTQLNAIGTEALEAFRQRDAMLEECFEFMDRYRPQHALNLGRVVCECWENPEKECTCGRDQTLAALHQRFEELKR